MQGEVKAGRLFGNHLIVASGGEVAEFNASTLHKSRVRSYVAPEGRLTRYEPTPTGLWVIGDKALSYFDLDGRPAVEKVRPLVAVNKQPCPANWANVKQPCSVGLQPDHTTTVASEAGDIVVVETFKELYPYAGRNIDEVWPSTATVLDRNGAIISQKPWSWMKTRWEWFWFKEGSSHSVPAAWPQLGGLVRTRYETDGVSPSQPVLARGGALLFWGGQATKMVLSRLDRDLNILWNRKLGNLAPPIVSPSWASPILIHNNICREFATISDRGSVVHEQTIDIPDLARELWNNHFKRPRFAIGQSSEGDWLLIAY